MSHNWNWLLIKKCQMLVLLCKFIEASNVPTFIASLLFRRFALVQRYQEQATFLRGELRHQLLRLLLRQSIGDDFGGNRSPRGREHPRVLIELAQDSRDIGDARRHGTPSWQHVVHRRLIAGVTRSFDAEPRDVPRDEPSPTKRRHRHAHLVQVYRSVERTETHLLTRVEFLRCVTVSLSREGNLSRSIRHNPVSARTHSRTQWCQILTGELGSCWPMRSERVGVREADVNRCLDTSRASVAKLITWPSRQTRIVDVAQRGALMWPSQVRNLSKKRTFWNKFKYSSDIFRNKFFTGF